MLLGLAGGAATLADDPVVAIVNEVSQESFRQYLDDLLYTHDGQRRGLPPYDGEHDLARDNIYDEFVSFGLDTYLDGFPMLPPYPPETYHNVVGIHRGVGRPDEIYVCGAHFDTVWNSPGADDDGSGTATVLEAARVLSQYDFEATIVFIAFDREEQGLFGSTAYAVAHRNEDIRGALCLDMVGYNPTGNDRVLARHWIASNPFQVAVMDAITTYSGGLTPVDRAGGGSDHWSFAQQGILDCGLKGEDSDRNPYYHSPMDSVDTPNYIDYAFTTKIVRGVVGFLANAAELSPCAGDLDGDGDTDLGDLGILLSNFGCFGGNCVGDLDGDGDTDLADLGILLGDFGCGV